MNGWSSHAGADRWDDQPPWVYEITWEWEPLPGQRYPGDPGRRKAVHTPVYDASGYEDYIYAGAPEPPLAPEEAAWAQQLAPRPA